MKPAALLYCQHSLGLGHFVRSLALAEAMADHFDVLFLNGGPVPAGLDLPAAIRFAHLPPLRLQEDGSITGAGETAALLAQRRDRMLALARDVRPALLLVELYPFGRKKFAAEIDPLIAEVAAGGGRIACSVRDILVTGRDDQARHDDRAAAKLNAAFDLLIVHSDIRLFDLSESFKPGIALTLPVSHSGFVVRAGAETSVRPGGNTTLVAAGGGAVGYGLYCAAVAAQPQLWEKRGWPMALVAGPLLPEAEWQDLQVRARGVSGLTLHRAVPAMRPLLEDAGRFAGQCGYNSALEVVQAGVPALFVPFARGQESEQTARAVKLEQLGMAEWLPEAGLTAEALAQRLLSLAPPAAQIGLDLDGARKSAALLRELAA